MALHTTPVNVAVFRADLIDSERVASAYSRHGARVS